MESMEYVNHTLQDHERQLEEIRHFNARITVLLEGTFGSAGVMEQWKEQRKELYNLKLLVAYWCGGLTVIVFVLNFIF